MQPLFTNHTVMDADTCTDFLRLGWAKNSGIARIVLFGAGVGAATYATMMLVEGGTSALVFAIAAYIMAVVALLMVFFGWRLRAKKYVKEQQALWGGETLEKDVFFYDDFIIQKSRLGSQNYDYSDVSELRHNQRCLVISLRGGKALLIRKNGFAPGDFEKVLALLKQKIKENRKK